MPAREHSCIGRDVAVWTPVAAHHEGKRTCLNGYLVQFIERELNDLKPRTGPRRDLSTHNLGNKQPPTLSPKKKKKKKTKLRTYRTIKQTLTCEQYLNSKDRQARQTMTRLRGGTNELRIETGRHPITNRDRRLEVEEKMFELYVGRDRRRESFCGPLCFR